LSRTPNALREWACACGVAALAFLIRALSFANVFHAGQVVFAPADAMYHVRRSYYTFESWPHLLLFDPYVNYPDGAPIPWSPLPDFLAGSLAALLADGDAGFETVLAWWPVAVGALGALPIYFLARELAPRLAAVGAGCLYAMLPISVAYGRVGNPDHHVSAAAVGACLLLVCTKLLADAPSTARLRALAFALAVVRAALLWTWHGSLLYLAVAEASLLLAAALTGRRELHAVHAASAVGTLLLVGPLLATFPTPLLGPYSSIALSRLHLIAVAGAGVVAFAGFLRASRSGREMRALANLGFLLAVGVGFGLCVLALPGPRAGLEPAFRFLTMTDAAGAMTIEQFALFPLFGRSSENAAANTWGGYAYLLPLAPVALLVRARARAAAGERAQLLLVAGWAAAFGFLALSQRRYGNDVAAAASVGFALGGAQLASLLVARLRLPRAAAAVLIFALGAALYAQPIAGLYAPWARRGLAKLAAAPGEQTAPPATAAWAIHRFLRAVRAVTPETTGYTHPAARPEYGIVSQANLGHALQWVARRATPTDPFWEYIGPENWDRAFELLTAVRESRAVELAAELDARYVVVGPSATDGLIGDRLFRDDGLRRGRLPALRRFRLVTEGPRGGRPIQSMFEPAVERPDEFVPYKLFEVVRGAQLEIPAPPGARVDAVLRVRTPAAREFTFYTSARSDPEGTARLRVPYANRPSAAGGPHDVVTDPSWRIRIAGAEAGTIVVPEAAVLEGRTIAGF
jgi:dolichyl-diphosphooligosaccharide--protein glycosyltransferase